MIKEVSTKLLGQFVDCLEQRFAAEVPEPAPAAEAPSAGDSATAAPAAAVAAPAAARPVSPCRIRGAAGPDEPRRRVDGQAPAAGGGRRGGGGGRGLCPQTLTGGRRPRCCAGSTGRRSRCRSPVRLRQHGVPVGLTAIEDFTRALARLGAGHGAALYWTARIALVRRQSELAAFDEVFDAVFRDATLEVDPVARRGAGPAPGAADTHLSVPKVGAEPAPGDGLPWATLPPAVADGERTTTEPRAARALGQRPGGRGRPAVRAARARPSWRSWAVAGGGARGTGRPAGRGAARRARAAARSRCARRSPGPGVPAGSRSTWCGSRRCRGRARW